MNRTAASLAALAAVAAVPLLAGCGTPPPQTEGRIASREMPYRAGQGVVIARTAAPAMAASAAAGASVPAPYRLAIRMSDGRVTYVDTDNASIREGMRVELGADHTLRPL